MRADVCRHFTGFAKSSCAAEVKYEQVGRPQQMRFREMPCFSEGPDTCLLRAFPTAEELAAHKREVQELVDRDLKVRAAIGKAADGRRPCHGRIDCPICGEPLEYRVAENGHALAACSSPGCVAFIE